MDYELMMNGNVKIGMQAPDFEAESTYGKISLNDYRGKWVVLFSHPGDFTPVCTTEMIAFANFNHYFTEKNTCLLGLSIDSNASHLAWVYDIYKKNDISSTATVRNVYIMNPEGIIRLILVYPMDVGRCIPEILRALDALQIAEKCKGSTPANWTPGGPIINPMPNTYTGLEKRVQNLKNNKNGISWYLTFKEECQANIIENKNIKELKEKN